MLEPLLWKFSLLLCPHLHNVCVLVPAALPLVQLLRRALVVVVVVVVVLPWQCFHRAADGPQPARRHRWSPGKKTMRPVVAICRSRLLVRNLSLLLAFLPFAWVAAGGAEAGPAPTGTRAGEATVAKGAVGDSEGGDGVSNKVVAQLKAKLRAAVEVVSPPQPRAHTHASSDDLTLSVRGCRMRTTKRQPGSKSWSKRRRQRPVSSQISKSLPSTINHTTGHLDPTPSPMQNESYEDAERLKKLVKDDVAQASVEKVHGEKEEITSSQDSTIAMQDRDGEATKAMKQKGTILNEEKKQSATEEKAAAEKTKARAEEEKEAAEETKTRNEQQEKATAEKSQKAQAAEAKAAADEAETHAVVVKAAMEVAAAKNLAIEAAQEARDQANMREEEERKAADAAAKLAAEEQELAEVYRKVHAAEERAKEALAEAQAAEEKAANDEEKKRAAELQDDAREAKVRAAEERALADLFKKTKATEQKAAAEAAKTQAAEEKAAAEEAKKRAAQGKPTIEEEARLAVEAQIAALEARRTSDPEKIEGRIEKGPEDDQENGADVAIRLDRAMKKCAEKFPECAATTANDPTPKACVSDEESEGCQKCNACAEKGSTEEGSRPKEELIEPTEFLKKLDEFMGSAKEGREHSSGYAMQTLNHQKPSILLLKDAEEAATTFLQALSPEAVYSDYNHLVAFTSNSAFKVWFGDMPGYEAEVKVYEVVTKHNLNRCIHMKSYKRYKLGKHGSYSEFLKKSDLGSELRELVERVDGTTTSNTMHVLETHRDEAFLSSLHEVIADDVVNSANLIRLFRDIVVALKEFQDLGIMHNDLHCGNVLVSKTGIKVFDFDLSLKQPTKRDGIRNTLCAPQKNYSNPGMNSCFPINAFVPGLDLIILTRNVYQQLRKGSRTKFQKLKDFLKKHVDRTVFNDESFFDTGDEGRTTGYCFRSYRGAGTLPPGQVQRS